MAKARVLIELENLTYQQMIDCFAEIVAETVTNLSGYSTFDITIDGSRHVRDE